MFFPEPIQAVKMEEGKLMEQTGESVGNQGSMGVEGSKGELFMGVAK